jgi:hypothetical protein
MNHPVKKDFIIVPPLFFRYKKAKCGMYWVGWSRIMMILYKIFVNTIGMVVFAYLAQALYSFQRDRKIHVKFIVLASLGANVLYFLDKYIGMGLRALILLPVMTFMLYYILKLSILQSIVVSITYAIALAVGDLSAVFVMVKIYGYPLQSINSQISLSLISELIIYGTVVIIILLIRFIKQTQEMTDKYKRGNSIRTSLYMLATFIVITVNYAMYIKFIGVVDQSNTRALSSGQFYDFFQYRFISSLVLRSAYYYKTPFFRFRH